MIKPGIYQHYKKGNRYRVHFVAKHSETLEEFVVYEALYDNPDGKYWVRPSKMFSEMVEMGDKRIQRFQYIPKL
jgi:hypothetical protein